MSLHTRLFGAFLCCAVLPGLAAAEGNRLTLACAPLAPADAGSEETAPLPASPGFLLAPVKTDRAGAGEIQATGPDGGPFAGVTASHTGPFAWTAGTVLNTLTVEGTTADGRTLVLWHRLDQAQAAVPPAGQLVKLICEVS
ncbi:MAG: hypothetical protein R3D80_03450 [Paracoccaceae bacterium]